MIRNFGFSLFRCAAVHASIFFTAVAVFLAVSRVGKQLVASGSAVGAQAPSLSAWSPRVMSFGHLLLALALVVVVALAFGWILRFLRQPPVLGDVMAGLVLGPSLLGRAWPEWSARIFDPVSTQGIGILAQLGVVLYMFLVGVELNVGQLRSRASAAASISHASIAAPFAMGSVLALVLYPRFATPGVPFYVFALFIGVSMSVTAFPVLARILEDMNLRGTPLATLALTCAAIDDLAAWCLLALVVSVATKGHGSPFVLLLTASYLAALLVVVRPLVGRFVSFLERREGANDVALAGVIAAVLVSSALTDAIGIHTIFGAFALGSMVPSGSRLARDLEEKLRTVVDLLLLPAFFAIAGLRTQIGLVSGWSDWSLCLLIIAVASIGKFGGAYAAARLSGMHARDAAVTGVLLNTRGLVELIVLNVGLDLGIISPTLFAMLVTMALATTLMTTPVVHALRRSAVRKERPILPDDRASSATPIESAFRAR